MVYSVTCVTTIKEAKAAWEFLSPHEFLSDEWNYRYLYYRYFEEPLEFYILKNNSTPVALLPLQVNDEGMLEFFGGRKFYQNSIFMHALNPDSYNILFSSIKKPMKLEGMNEPIPGIQCFEDEGTYYELDLEGITDWQSYLEKCFHSGSKKKLKSQMKKIESYGIEVVEDKSEDIEVLANLNKKQFRERSHFNKPHRIDYLKDLMKNYKTRVLSLHLEGEIIGVGLAVVYKNIYYGLTAGHDTSLNNLGKYLILKRIEQAVASGAAFYNAGRNDYGWKEHFHFEKKSLYSQYLLGSHLQRAM